MHIKVDLGNYIYRNNILKDPLYPRLELKLFTIEYENFTRIAEDEWITNAIVFLKSGTKVIPLIKLTLNNQ